METVLNLTVGFIVFLGICLGGILLKLKVKDYLKKVLKNETYLDVISDLFLIGFLLISSFLSAPLMGYGPNPLLKLFKF